MSLRDKNRGFVFSKTYEEESSTHEKHHNILFFEKYKKLNTKLQNQFSPSQKRIPSESEIAQRVERIRASILRINALMAELQDFSKK
jgi:hypothetical protein